MLSSLKLMLYAPFFLPVADSGIEKTCAARKALETDIEVNFNIARTVYDHKKSVKQISALSSGKVSAWNARHSGSGFYSTHTSGLTHGIVKYQYETQFVSMPSHIWGGPRCPYLKKLKVDITYGSTIYIGKEFEKDGCYFMEVLKHEHKHHNVNMKTTAEYVKSLRRDLPRVVAYLEGKSIHSDPNASINNLNKKLQEALEHYNENMNVKMEGLNAKVDTPQEYERVAKVCKDGSAPGSLFGLW